MTRWLRKARTVYPDTLSWERSWRFVDNCQYDALKGPNVCSEVVYTVSLFRSTKTPSVSTSGMRRSGRYRKSYFERIEE